jgi:uncharacterized protein (DUF2225 family)
VILSLPLEPYYEKKIACPYCEVSYSTRKVRSRVANPYKIDTDFCPRYKADQINPLYYNVNVCHSCGYSFNDKFYSFFPPGAKEEIQDKIVRSWRGQDYSNERDFEKAVETYKLAIYCAELKREKPIVLAGLCMRLAWLYRYQEDAVNETRFLQLALKKYEDQLMGSSSFDPDMSEMKVIYLVGEIQRRLGMDTEAVKSFSSVVNHRNKLVEKNVVNMARERWDEIREKRDKEKQAMLSTENS